MIVRWNTRIAVALALCALGLGVSAPTTGPSLECQVKAAFLQKFTSFIEWPHYSFYYEDSPFAIGVLGDDPFGDVLESVVADKDYDGREYAIRRGVGAEELAGCQILFISSSEAARLGKILADLEADGVLTVGDTPDFTEQGGMIRFYTEEGRLRFEINLAAAQSANLQISSKLLSLAKVVGGPPQEE